MTPHLIACFKSSLTATHKKATLLGGFFV